MTGKPDDGPDVPDVPLHSLGRSRMDPPGGQGARPPGPVFDRVPPSHPLLTELHVLWIEATEDDIGSIVTRARELASAAPPEVADWAVRYVEALERLEYWLRDL